MQSKFIIVLIGLFTFLTYCTDKEFNKDVVVNSKISGTYESLPDSALGKYYDAILSLAMDSSAVLSIYKLDEPSHFIKHGKWYHEHEKIILDLDDQRFLFELINEDLVALEYDTTRWGKNGFELKRELK